MHKLIAENLNQDKSRARQESDSETDGYAC